jgi:hypothetical protein
LCADITLLKLAYAVHRAAKDAFGTVTLQNNVVPLHKNFYGIALVHLISLTQRLWKNDSPQLIDLSNYTSRFHNNCTPLSSSTSDFWNSQTDNKGLVV